MSDGESFSDFQLEEAILLKSLSNLARLDEILDGRLGESLGVDHSHGFLHLGVIIRVDVSLNDEHDTLTGW